MNSRLSSVCSAYTTSLLFFMPWKRTLEDRTEGIRPGPTLTEMIRGTQGGARICSESIKNFWYVVGAVHCISVLHLSR